MSLNDASKRRHTLNELIRVTCSCCRFEWLEREVDFESSCLRCGSETLTTRPFDIDATPTKRRLEVVT